MENKLAENIRDYRKSLGLTQEQLAERLEITLGTVSKWERGSSEPDLGYIMDLAELFHVSVDALVGFTMHGADAGEEAGRIEAMVNKAPFEEVEVEYENALKKFPNHFQIVVGAASICKRYGTLHQDETHLKRALELYRHAMELLPQNSCPEINEVLIRNEIAGCYADLKEYKKAVEEYKKNNLSGNSDANIGLLMILHKMNVEEGIEYTERAFINQLSNITTVMRGYIHYYMETGNTARCLRTAEWMIELLRKSKEKPDQRSYLDKIISLYGLLRAVVLDSEGQTEESEEALREAVQMARAFDADPVYTLENVAFTEHAPNSVYVYDDKGPTAVDGLRGTLDEVGDLVSASFRVKFEKAIG